jgi:hypothetical protein
MRQFKVNLTYRMLNSVTLHLRRINRTTKETDPLECLGDGGSCRGTALLRCNGIVHALHIGIRIGKPIVDVTYRMLNSVALNLRSINRTTKECDPLECVGDGGSCRGTALLRCNGIVHALHIGIRIGKPIVDVTYQTLHGFVLTLQFVNWTTEKDNILECVCDGGSRGTAVFWCDGIAYDLS